MTESRSERERRKNSLRDRVIEGGPRSRRTFARFYEDNRKAIRLAAAAAAGLLLLVISALLLMKHFWLYRTYDVMWSVEDYHGSTASYIPMGDSVIVIGADGAVCYNVDGKKMWTEPFDMSHPVWAKQGKYLLIYDRMGMNLRLCTKSGLSAQMTAAAPVSHAVVSRAGVSAVVTESSSSSTISYYDRLGKKLDLTVQAPMEVSGYPLDLAISPDGQQLMVSYYYVSRGRGRCSIKFYDFSRDSVHEDHVAAVFDYGDRGTYIPYVTYLSGSRACAVGDDCVLFYDVPSPGEAAELASSDLGETVNHVFTDSGRICVVTDTQDSGGVQHIYIYDNAGRQQGMLEEGKYRSYAVLEDHLLLISEDRCRIREVSGRIRLDLDISSLERVLGIVYADGMRTLYLASGGMLQKIRLR